MEVAMGFADCIGLKGREREYFLLLVACNQEEAPSQRQILFQRLQDLNGTPATRLREDQDAFLASWRHAALREMLGIDPFQGGEAQWGERMVPAATAGEVRAFPRSSAGAGIGAPDRQGNRAHRSAFGHRYDLHGVGHAGFHAAGP